MTRRLVAGYREDFNSIFGFPLEAHWTQITRLPLYSPVFTRNYVNPPITSSSWQNVLFAGNFRTFPCVASTGTALGSGIETADAILKDAGIATQIPTPGRAVSTCIDATYVRRPLRQANSSATRSVATLEPVEGEVCTARLDIDRLHLKSSRLERNYP